jgi:hypothetical protein
MKWNRFWKRIYRRIHIISIRMVGIPEYHHFEDGYERNIIGGFFEDDHPSERHPTSKRLHRRVYQTIRWAYSAKHGRRSMDELHLFFIHMTDTCRYIDTIASICNVYSLCTWMSSEALMETAVSIQFNNDSKRDRLLYLRRTLFPRMERLDD